MYDYALCVHNMHQGGAVTHKNERQAKILEIVGHTSIATQAQLARRLKAAGLPCTQASVSRDIRELHLVKREGHYVADPDAVALQIPELGDTVRRFGNVV